VDYQKSKLNLFARNYGFEYNLD